jgi:hypothetical protein
MARIKPGSLSGAAVPLWTQMDIRMPRTSRRKRKDRIQPQEILAWFNLAQTVAKDESILGGIVNAISRKSRESELAEQRQQDASRAAREEATGRVQPGLQPPPGAPTMAPGPQSLPPQGLLELPQGPTSTLPTAPPGPMSMQPPAAAPAPVAAPMQPQPQQVSTPASRPGELAAQAGQAGPLPTFQDALRMQQEADLEAEKARTAEFAKIKAYTFQDLMAMAAGAQNGEQLRHVMAMVPQVMEQDPSFAPRSLSDLLFGGGGQSSADLSKTLIQAYLSRQGKMRSPSQQAGDIARAADAYGRSLDRQARTPSRIEKDTAKAALDWSQVEYNRLRGELTEARTKKITDDAKRRAKRRGGKGYLGTKGDKWLSKYGVYLDAVKKNGGSADNMPVNLLAMVPDEFVKFDKEGNRSSALGENTALGIVNRGVGKRGRGQVAEQVDFYLAGKTKPARSNTARLNREDRLQNQLTDAIKAYNKAFQTSTTKTDEIMEVKVQSDAILAKEAAAKSLPGLLRALEAKKSQLEGAGFTITINDIDGEKSATVTPPTAAATGGGQPAAQATPSQPTLKGRVRKKGE